MCIRRQYRRFFCEKGYYSCVSAHVHFGFVHNIVCRRKRYDYIYVDLTRLSASLNISGTTASCSGTAKTLISTDTIKMSMYLQKQTSTGWSNVASWYKEGTRLISLDKTKGSLSPGTYRVHLYVVVYDTNGGFVESANAYSKSKTV